MIDTGTSGRHYLAAVCAAAMLVAAAAAPANAAALDPTSGASGGEKAPPAQQAPAVAEDHRNYCIVERPTGSHIARRTCQTRLEWIKQTGIDPVTIAR